MTFEELQQKIADALPHDKCLHAIAGQVLALAALPLGVRWSCALVCSVAIGKEVYDLAHPQKHTAEASDALATISGGLPIWLLVHFITHT